MIFPTFGGERPVTSHCSKLFCHVQVPKVSIPSQGCLKKMFATKNKSATKNFRKTEQQNHPTNLNTLQNRMSSVVAIKHAPLGRPKYFKWKHADFHCRASYCGKLIMCNEAENKFSSVKTGAPNFLANWLNYYWNLLQLNLPENPHHVPRWPQFVGWRSVRPSCENLPKAPELAELESGVGSSNRKSTLLTGLNFEPAVVANLSCPSGSSEPSSFLFQKFPNQILTSLHSWI